MTKNQAKQNPTGEVFATAQKACAGIYGLNRKIAWAFAKGYISGV